MASNNYYAPGQWEFICDLCGAKNKSGNARKTWDGFYVCAYHKEVRNPQDYLRGVRDDQHVPWSRPGGTDTFVPGARTIWFDESIGLTEFFFVQGNAKTQALSDTLPLAEGVSKGLNKAFAESLPVVESISNRPTRNSPETLALAESVTTGPRPTVGESVAVTEAKSVAFVKVISENVGIVENVLFPVSSATVLGGAALGTVSLG